jgi:hypothetical protein
MKASQRAVRPMDTFALEMAALVARYGKGCGEGLSGDERWELEDQHRPHFVRAVLSALSVLLATDGVGDAVIAELTRRESAGEE